MLISGTELKGRTKASFVDFTKKAIAHLIGVESEPTRGRQKRVSANVPVQHEDHFPENIPARGPASERIRRKCTQCTKMDKRRTPTTSLEHAKLLCASQHALKTFIIK